MTEKKRDKLTIIGASGNCKVCDTTAGADAVVIKNITVKGTYIGVVARKNMCVLGGGNYLEYNMIPLFFVTVMGVVA